jgi:3-dehydroquinate synthase
MKTIDVKIPGKEYPIFLGDGIVGRLVGLLKSNKSCENVFLVVDRNILRFHSLKVERVIESLKGKKYMHIFDSSESNKSFYGAEKIYSDLINQGFTRDSVIVPIGGGITGDITGFVASTFMRGVRFVQVPTTLLSVVDSSVGGKTGINFENTKNIVGTFTQPEFVLVDTDFLKTLPEEELICGIGEILKYAFLSDEVMFNTLLHNLNKLLTLDAAFTKKIVETCVRFKGDVVTKDEKESGLRKILNLGHTFAHAFEVEQDYSIKHGQAVAVGIMCALELSLALDLINETKFERFKSLPLLIKDKINLHHYNSNRIYEIMKRDKKGSADKIKFVLLTDIGRLVVDVTASEEEVKLAINRGAAYFLKKS